MASLNVHKFGLWLFSGQIFKDDVQGFSSMHLGYLSHVRKSLLKIKLRFRKDHGGQRINKEHLPYSCMTNYLSISSFRRKPVLIYGCAVCTVCSAPENRPIPCRKNFLPFYQCVVKTKLVEYNPLYWLL